MDQMINYSINNCVYCDSKEIYVIQLRKNLYLTKSIYFCKSCKKRFTPDNGFKKFRFPPVVIKTAIKLLEGGASLARITSYLDYYFRIKISRKTILDWKNKFLTK